MVRPGFVFSGSRLFVYGYDQVGNLTSDEVLGGVGVSTFEHDTLDRLTKKVTLGGAVYYAYDLSGRKTSLKDADLQENVYVYDAAGRLTTLQVDAGRSAYYHHDGSGLATTRLLPGNDVQAYMSYDVAGRLLDLLNHNPINGVLSSNAYVRNQNGAITKIVQQFGQHTYYDYDPLDRQTRDFVFDGFDTVRDNRYSYDVASNRSTKSDLVSPSETYYAYDLRNLLTREHVVSTSPPSTTTAYYDYDSSQRMTTQRSVSEATYFAHSQRDQISLVQHAAVSPDVVQYFNYSGTGERVRVREGATEAYWSHDGSKLMRERLSTGTTARRYRNNEGRVAGGKVEIESSDVPVAGGIVHPAYNEDGSAVQLATSNDIAESYSYDRFGVTTDSGTTGQRAKYVSDGLIALATTQDIYLTPGGLYLPRIATTTVTSFGLYFNLGLGSGLPLEGPYDPWEEESHDDGPLRGDDVLFGSLPDPYKKPWRGKRFRRWRRTRTPGPMLPPIRDGGEAPPLPPLPPEHGVGVPADLPVPPWGLPIPPFGGIPVPPFGPFTPPTNCSEHMVASGSDKPIRCVEGVSSMLPLDVNIATLALILALGSYTQDFQRIAALNCPAVRCFSPCACGIRPTKANRRIKITYPTYTIGPIVPLPFGLPSIPLPFALTNLVGIAIVRVCWDVTWELWCE